VISAATGRLCVALALLGVAVSGPSSRLDAQTDASPASPQASRVAFMLHGRIYTQPAPGGKPLPATAAEAKAWRSKTRAVLETVSPDGKYRVVKLPNRRARGQAPFQVVRLADGKALHVDLGESSSIDGSIVVFDGWLPDSEHIAVWLDGMAPNGGSTGRRIIDVTSAGTTEFNGWVGPGGRSAIVLRGEGYGRDPGYAEECVTLNPGPPEGDGKADTSPPIPFLAVTSPVEIAEFSVSAARTTALTLDGKPLLGLQTVAPRFGEDDPVARRPSVEFSRDGWWALLHRHQDEAGKRVAIDYIVSLKTGVVRQLPGTGAAFL
jgi:hypothetical protein